MVFHVNSGYSIIVSYRNNNFDWYFIWTGCSAALPASLKSSCYFRYLFSPIFISHSVHSSMSWKKGVHNLAGLASRHCLEKSLAPDPSHYYLVAFSPEISVNVIVQPFPACVLQGFYCRTESSFSCLCRSRSFALTVASISFFLWYFLPAARDARFSADIFPVHQYTSFLVFPTFLDIAAPQVSLRLRQPAQAHTHYSLQLSPGPPSSQSACVILP